jgi:pimeloyl-ACP methyl ester carboxylesterase
VEATYTTMHGEIEHMYARHGLLSEIPASAIAKLVGGLDLSQLEPVKLVCGLGSRPLLLVYGSEDPTVPVEQARQMAEAACPPEQLTIVNARTHGEYMQSADADTYSAQLLQFFGGHLILGR